MQCVCGALLPHVAWMLLLPDIDGCLFALPLFQVTPATAIFPQAAMVSPPLLPPPLPLPSFPQLSAFLPP